MHRPDVAGGTPGTAPAGVTQHDPCRHLVMDSLTPSGWRSNRPCSGRSHAGERPGLLVPGGPTRALERCPWPTGAEGASGLRGSLAQPAYRRPDLGGILRISPGRHGQEASPYRQRMWSLPPARTATARPLNPPTPTSRCWPRLRVDSGRSRSGRLRPALQALALGRAETSACQRARFSQDSGTGTRAAMEAKSTAHKAVMSAMVNASPATNRDWARSSFSLL